MLQNLLLIEMCIGGIREMVSHKLMLQDVEREMASLLHTHTNVTEFHSFYLVMCPLSLWLPGASSSSKFATGLNTKCRNRNPRLKEAF